MFAPQFRHSHGELMAEPLWCFLAMTKTGYLLHAGQRSAALLPKQSARTALPVDFSFTSASVIVGIRFTLTQNVLSAASLGGMLTVRYSVPSTVMPRWIVSTEASLAIDRGWAISASVSRERSMPPCTRRRCLRSRLETAPPLQPCDRVESTCRRPPKSRWLPCSDR